MPRRTAEQSPEDAVKVHDAAVKKQKAAYDSIEKELEAEEKKAVEVEFLVPGQYKKRGATTEGDPCEHYALKPAGFTCSLPESQVSVKWMRCKDPDVQKRLEKAARDKKEAQIKAAEEKAKAAEKLNSLLTGN